MWKMSVKIEENTSELVNILSSVNCPLIIRSDDWWIEELLFKPGKPRTELIVWIISKAIVNSGSFSSNVQDLDSTNVSTASNGRKLPESDEAILELLCIAGVCTDKDLPFVKGVVSKNDQLKYWNILIKPLQYLPKSSVNTNIAFGCGSLSNIVSMENFLDAFSMKASLLPADLKSEIEQLSKETKGKGQVPKTQAGQERNVINDKLFIQNFSEQANRLKFAAEQFIEISKTDLKIFLPKNETSGRLIEIGDETNSISTKLTTWKKGVDSLLELQQNTLSEVNRTRADNLLKRSIKDKSFSLFQKLCGTE